MDELKLKMLRSSLVSLEIEMSIIEKDMDFIVYDIEYLEKIKGTLTQNKKILKSQKIVSMASSYKKTVMDIENVKARLKSYYHVLNKKRESFEKIEQQYEKLNKDIQMAEEYLANKRIVVDFEEAKRKRKGRND